VLDVAESQKMDDLYNLAAVVQQGAGGAAGRGPAGAGNPQSENADPNAAPVADPMDEFVEIIEMVEQASGGNSKRSPQANEPRYQQRPLLVHGQSFEDRTDNSSKNSSRNQTRPPKESPGSSTFKRMAANEAARSGAGSINVVYNREM
jgi:hypothetical protein